MAEVNTLSTADMLAQGLMISTPIALSSISLPVANPIVFLNSENGDRLTHITGSTVTDVEDETFQNSVADRDLTAPPGSPAVADRYIVATGGTGAWSGEDDKIATWDGTGWVFSPPTTGMVVGVIDEARFVRWSGSAWAFLGTVIAHDSLITGTIASHDTGATGAELDTLTDTSNADGLHAHAHSATTGQGTDDHHNESHTVVSHSDTTATGAELNTLTGGNDASSLHTHFPTYRWTADQLMHPGMDWKVTVGSTSGKDSNNASIFVRKFSAAVDQGAGQEFDVPAGATNMVLTMSMRPETTPGGTTTNDWEWYSRDLTGAVAAWSASAVVLDQISIVTNENWIEKTTTKTIGAWNLAVSKDYKFELVRDSGDSMSEMATLRWVRISFT